MVKRSHSPFIQRVSKAPVNLTEDQRKLLEMRRAYSDVQKPFNERCALWKSIVQLQAQMPHEHWNRIARIVACE